MTSEHFPAVEQDRLAEPLDLGKRILRHRIVQAPLSVSYGSPTGEVTAATVGHYARRAAGGAAMVMTENFAVSQAGRQLPRQGLISGPEYLDGLSELASAIKSHGALAVIQIVHAGRYAGPWEQYEAARRLAPSAVPFGLTATRTVTPAEATLEELEQARREFVAAARLARDAGFDGVHVHGAQGFLLSSFQSPRMNKRSDEYGGDFDGRTRLAREVVSDILDAVGDDMLVGYHLMSDEMMPGGWGPSEAARLAHGLGEIGVDFIAPIPTTFESIREQVRLTGNDPTVFNADVFREISAATDTPLFANGGLGSPGDARAVLDKELADVIMQGRPLLVDPDWSHKALNGKEDSIVVCSCDPATCKTTQLTGVVCHSWSEADQSRGFVGV
ncbi:NADH:flavin oxidoreductase [Streptomyces sp. NPDC096132]|uniref:oxidoreductase n=1 Tax=Streptomyces sp. NPDC096132 TaxID=3366075 RepID=UPI003821F7FB